MVKPVKPMQIEIKDNVGETIQYKDTISSGAPLTITNAGKKIDEFIVKNLGNKDLNLKIGTSAVVWEIDKKDDLIIWTPKGSVDQIVLEPKSGSTKYQAIINWADC